MFPRRALRMFRRLRTKLIVGLFSERQYQGARAGLPERKVGNVSIYAREPFAEEVAAALLTLKDGYPYGYSLVQRYLRAVVETELRPELGQIIGVQYDKRSPEGQLPLSAKRYAAFLVSLAAAIRLTRGFYFSRSMRGELLVLRQDLKAMRTLGCESKYFHRISNEVLRREKTLLQRKPRIST